MFCFSDVDPCDSNPCLNHATCIRSGYTSDYTCNCAQGYSGIQCQTSEQNHTLDLLIYWQIQTCFVLDILTKSLVFCSRGILDIVLISINYFFIVHFLKSVSIT